MTIYGSRQGYNPQFNFHAHTLVKETYSSLPTLTKDIKPCSLAPEKKYSILLTRQQELIQSGTDAEKLDYISKVLKFREDLKKSKKINKIIIEKTIKSLLEGITVGDKHISSTGTIRRRFGLKEVDNLLSNVRQFQQRRSGLEEVDPLLSNQREFIEGNTLTRKGPQCGAGNTKTVYLLDKKSEVLLLMRDTQKITMDERHDRLAEMLKEYELGSKCPNKIIKETFFDYDTGLSFIAKKRKGITPGSLTIGFAAQLQHLMHRTRVEIDLYHGDWRLDNILSKGSKYYAIDFGSSVTAWATKPKLCYHADTRVFYKRPITSTHSKTSTQHEILQNRQWACTVLEAVALNKFFTDGKLPVAIQEDSPFITCYLNETLFKNQAIMTVKNKLFIEGKEYRVVKHEIVQDDSQPPYFRYTLMHKTGNTEKDYTLVFNEGKFFLAHKTGTKTNIKKLKPKQIVSPGLNFQETMMNGNRKFANVRLMELEKTISYTLDIAMKQGESQKVRTLAGKLYNAFTYQEMT